MRNFFKKIFCHLSPTKFTTLYFLVGALFVSYKHELIAFFPVNTVLPKSTNLYIDIAILIATTSIVNVLLINLKQYDQAKIQNNQQFLRNKLIYLSWIFVILILIPLVNLGIYHHQVPKIERKTYENLQAIAAIKVQQLKTWMDYRLADGDILSADTQFADAVSRFISTGASTDADTIKARFDALMEAYHYQGVTLIDRQGNALVHVGDNSDFNTQVSDALISTVNTLKKTHHSDFYIDDSNQLNLQVLAPVFGKNSDPLAYVFIQTGFYGPILPSLQMWPSYSTTSDSLLFKRNQQEIIIVDATPDDFNGDGIHFLKYSKDSVYDPAVPIANGKNLQGKAAYSAILPITGTSWYYLTEVSKDEVMAELYQLLVWTGVSALIALGIVSSVLTLLWKQQKAAYRLALALKDVELNKLLDKFHHMPFIGIGTIDGMSRKWTDVNPRLCEILGYDAQSLLKLKCNDLSHPEEATLDDEFQTRLTSGEINHYIREKRFIHQSGKTVYARIEVSAIRNDYDAIELLVVAVEDITDRITAEAALKNSEQRLDLVVKGSNDGWWDLDLEKNYAYHSKRWWQMLGYDENTDISDPMHWQKLAHPNDIEPTLALLRKTFASDRNQYELEIRLRHKDGHYVPVLTRGYILRDTHGKPIRVSGTNTDITEFKKTDREIVTLNRLLSMITNTNQLITRKPGSVVLFSELCKIAVDEGGFNFAWVGLLTKDRTQLKCVTYAGVSKSFIESLDHNLKTLDYHIPAIECITAGEYIICNDLTNTDYEEHWVASALESGYRSMVALPIAQYGKVVGNFSLFSNETQAFGEKEITLLDELAADVSYALEIEDGESQRKKTEKALIESEALFHNLASNSPAGIFRTDKHGKLTYYNDIWLQITDADPDEVHTGKAFPSTIFSEDAGNVLAIFQESLHNKAPFDMEYRLLHSNGEIVWVKSQAQPCFDDKGLFTGYVGTMTDITELKSIQESLRMAGVVMDNSREAILVADSNNNIVMVNKAFSDLEGYRFEEIIGKNPKILNSGKHDREYFVQMYAALDKEGVFQSEIWNRSKSGAIHPGIISITAVKNDKQMVTHYVSVFTDITSLKNTEERLAFLANHDALTGLPNRMMLISHISHAIEGAKRNNNQLALLLLDLDRFKNINDSFGHLAGDDLLQKLAERLKSRLRGNDMIARLGGDEFVILLEDISQPEYAAKVAESVIACIEQPWTLNNGSEVYIGTSIGISLYPDHGNHALDLLKHADAAMYQAKASGRGMARYYSESLTRQARRRFTLEAKLRDAISHNELQLYYQPKFDVFNGKLVGAEALVRWIEDDGLMILPNEFISIAEETGLINKLGEWVLNEACKQGKAWLDKGLDISIAVNLSATQLYHSNIAKTISDILQTTGFPAKNLELELTESILMRRESESIKTLYQIKNLGITLAVDDFGAGYSSLAYLRRFPLDVLKIDRSFIADLEDDKDDRAITATIIAIGRTLNLQVIAEGVETGAQLAFLSSHGCHMYQGFYASPALQAQSFEAFIEEYSGNNVFA